MHSVAEDFFIKTWDLRTDSKRPASLIQSSSPLFSVAISGTNPTPFLFLTREDHTLAAGDESSLKQYDLRKPVNPLCSIVRPLS